MQFTCNAVSTYLNHIRIFLFFTCWGEGGGMIYQVHQSVLFSCWADVAIVHSKLLIAIPIDRRPESNYFAVN